MCSLALAHQPTVVPSVCADHFVHYGAEGAGVVAKEHPKAKDLLDVVLKDGSTIYHYPAEDPEKLTSNADAKRRTPLSYTELEPKLMVRNDELVELGFEPMGKEEFLSARMYTGPVSVQQQTTRLCAGR